MSLPMIYSCSGCSSAAQAADQVARRLDREGLAEMGCIAGVGGQVGPLLAKATRAPQLVAVDGCALSCAKACLLRAGRTPDRHYILSDLGVAKRFHADASGPEIEMSLLAVRQGLQELKSEAA